MKKRFDPPPERKGDQPRELQLQKLMGFGEFSARKSYYPELLEKLNELEREKDRYKWLFENALHGIFQAIIDGPMLSANPAIARICGYRDPAAICAQVQNIGEQLFADHQAYRQLIDSLAQTGSYVGFETLLQTAKGHRVEVSMNVLLKDAERSIVEIFVQDITERKKAQAQLRQLNATLEQRVRERTEELKKATQVAEQATLSKDKYLAAASHDLRQPMNAARLLVATLLERELEPHNQHLVESIHSAIQGAEDLLSDLLDISKLDANAVKKELSDFPIDALLEPLAIEFESQGREAGLRVHIRRNSANIVRSDPRLLIRVLRNFLCNALRYTAQGRILMGCRRRAGQLRIEVWDTGCGIAEDQLGDIFQEFKRLEQGKKTSDKGVGLGLAIVERIAKVLDHPITVKSWLGRGSCFAIDVPLSDISASQIEHVRASSIDTDKLFGCRLLVIDNEASIRLGMRELLQQWRCEVVEAENAFQAIARLQQQPPDMILADYHLNDGHNGLDAVQLLRQHYHADIPAIMITADRSHELRDQFKAQQLLRLSKPIKPGKLRAAISYYADRRDPTAAEKKEQP